MAKRLSYQEKRDNLIIEILNKMFEFAGHKVTFEDIKDRQDAVKAVLDAWFSRGRQLAVKNKDRLPHVVFPASPGIFFTLHFKCSIFYCY
jgi:hypothetical protein